MIYFICFVSTVLILDVIITILSDSNHIGTTKKRFFNYVSTFNKPFNFNYKNKNFILKTISTDIPTDFETFHHPLYKTLYINDIAVCTIYKMDNWNITYNVIWNGKVSYPRQVSRIVKAGYKAYWNEEILNYHNRHEQKHVDFLK